MSAKVRRGLYRRRCARCFWEGTYDTAGKANWAKRKHSCRKREDAMLRAAEREAREALIDRTPQPCLHKVANHEHGTRAAYVLDRCRCRPCAKANSDAELWRERQKAYGRYHKYVSAEFVRDHLRELGEYGIGLKRVAKLSGVSTGTLSKIVFGVYAPVEGEFKGCKGKGELVRERSRRVLRSTAEKIYAVEAVPANLGVGQPDHERTPTARLHLQALVALGWSQSKLGDRLGIQRSNMTPIVDGERVLNRGTVERIEALYAELSMSIPTPANRFEAGGITRARAHAKARGWLPPLALEDVADVELDDDYVDEAAIERRLSGDKSVRLHKGETAEAVRRALARGMNTGQIERHLGVKPERYIRLRDNQEAS